MRFALTLLIVSLACAAQADLKLPAIIGDHMVLQQQLANPIWGWDTPGTKITVSFAGQTKTATAEANGKWTLKLDPVPANAKPATLTIQGTSKRELTDILVGEVWLCSGQSNMGFTVGRTRDADVVTLGCDHPNIRLISVPNVGVQTPQDDFKGQWESATPKSVQEFTSVGFFYGRALRGLGEEGSARL
jgi:sialate O-acetylesterase